MKFSLYNLFNNGINLVVCLPLMVTLGLTGTMCSFLAPVDYIQGQEYRIIFIHVSCAWISIIIYCCITCSSMLYLCLKHPFFDIITFNGAKIGALFTLLTLISGCLWGKPMWGVFWVWDARLTSTLILFFIYLGYFQLKGYQNTRGAEAQMGSIFLCIGFLNIPIIKYSVSWWSTLHQPSSITQFGTSIHPSMLIPIDLMFIFFVCIAFFLLCLEIRHEIAQNQLKTSE